MQRAELRSEINRVLIILMLVAVAAAVAGAIFVAVQKRAAERAEFDRRVAAQRESLQGVPVP